MNGNGYRRAALQLYSLSESDRDWVLHKLPNERAERILRLIDELTELGIPKEQSWLIPAKTESESQFQSEQKVTPQQRAALEIESADIDVLEYVLDRESDAVVALILLYRSWSWRASYLNACNPQRRQRIEAKEESGVVVAGDNVLTALIEAFAETIAQPSVYDLAKNEKQKSAVANPSSSPRLRRLLWQR
jgi:hypothetical protein